ncbi:hypothetical protein [Parashewanella hymeniacidonis]|uniref:hypothetical protein n=1 Tax=Parashewanella hymeniacidonis TaxID=2807618 RepID=UPI001EF3FCE3|nr:hypothetical protein [Parashewanella hymeniacidonis]
MSTQAVIAVNRFGLGARLNELQQAEKDPKSFLISQLNSPVFNDKLPNSNQLLLHMAEFIQQRRYSNFSPDCVLPSKQKKLNRSKNLSFKKVISNSVVTL